MRWISRLRMLLARRPWLHWLVVGCLAVGVGAMIATAMADVRRQRQSWGDTTRVLVATRPIVAGESVTSAVEAHDVPAAVAPLSALHSIPASATATQRIAQGEVLVELDIAAASGPLALLPDGWLALAISESGSIGDAGNGATTDGASLFVAGDAASILANGQMIASDVVIVAVGPNAVVVGVPADAAARVADAASQHTAVVALRAP